MFRKSAVLMFMVALVVCVAMPGFAADAKEGRVEGVVVRRNTDKSTIVVRVRPSNNEKTVNYDASTKFSSAYHGDKKANPITADDIKDGDQVICLGSVDEKGDFHASSVSKRLSHSPE